MGWEKDWRALEETGSFDLAQKVEHLIEPILDAQGIELVEMALTGNDRRRMLRVFVDRPEGISIGECAGLSRSLADVLDTHDPIRGSYTLEVSSPGLTRPLRTPRDFQRAAGKHIKIVCKNGSVLVGALGEAVGSGLIVDVEGEAVALSLDDVAKANLHFEF